jgi:nucleoside-diphosphate-sugar epimerase
VKNQAMKVIVTGCAGFIGAKVVELLLDQGHSVVGIDNLNQSYDVRLKRWRLDHLSERACWSFYQADIADRAALFKVLDSVAKTGPSQAGSEPFDAVVNLAARAGVRQSVLDPASYLQTNVVGTLNLLDFCKERGVRKFVLASTSSLYGANNPCPFSEDANTDRPLSPYAASKKAAEALTFSYHHLHGLDVTVLRYFTVYGPAGRPDMSLFRLVQWISEGRPVTVFGDGNQSRDFTYVDDIARGTVGALGHLGYETINLGSNGPFKLNEAIALVEKATSRKANIVYCPSDPSDVRATWANIEKASRLLNWHPQVGFAAGIDRLVRWYQDNRAWAKDIATE